MRDRNQPQRRRRRRQRPVIGLCALLSLSATDASPKLQQHAVRATQREVDYEHVLENRPRDIHRKFWIPSMNYEHSSRRHLWERNPTEDFSLETLEEEEDGSVAWTLQVQGSSTRNEGIVTDKGELSVSYFLRKLFDQFIGQESFESDTFNSTGAANVTAEVSNSTRNETYVYTFSENANNTSNETESIEIQFQPLRITAFLDEIEGRGDLLTGVERDTLLRTILSPALVSWSNALRVDPVVGNLTVDVEQLLDGETCGPGMSSGLPSIRVPRYHMTEGVPDTDMILYLSLDFVVPRTNQTNSTNSTLQNVTAQGDDEALLLDMDAVEKLVLDKPLVQTDVSGSSNSEEETATILNNLTQDTVDEEPLPPGICSGDYLAAASFCSTDQYDRPTAALLHLCIDEEFFLPSQLSRNILTLMHEIGHALGFNSVSMAHFRNTDGTPITERVDGGEVPVERIECSGPQSERRFAKVPLPSEEILQFREVRGGVRVAEIVTPSVLQVVRNQFDCQDLTGAELESGEGLPLSSEEDGYGCLGDHWERRLFSSDLMNPVIDDLEYYPRISTITLAYFADSGWYQVDLSGSRVASGWGRGAGCGFVNETCISPNGEVPPHNAPFFCNEVPNSVARSVASEIHGCTADLTRKATCSMGRYGLDLPWEYQYFQDTYGSDVGGKDPYMDYCPVYRGYDNGLCTNSDTQYEMKASRLERFGERNSRCLVGSLGSFAATTALCLPIACVMEDRSLRVKIKKTWRRCAFAGQGLVEGQTTIECPDPRRVCPTFYCPYDCLGTGGECDYQTGQCMCEFPSRLGEGTVSRECGSEDEEEETTGSSMVTGVFVLPHPDSPFSEYYVTTERELNDNQDKTPPMWFWCVIVGGWAAFIGGIGVFIWARNKRSDAWYATWFQQPSNEEVPVEPPMITVN